ncbi:hypothetical protein Hsw_4146 [Hymenobacter swuensis DY53]|uniref:Uncharacterized protein n=1 Tax=Hymenobacter swuensis DY53 TaxID=1227739 RepID=W8FAS0_9BACT|nr:hypothetical protein Hsw_4146 [Hymenobacter swuensis DY53]
MPPGRLRLVIPMRSYSASLLYFHEKQTAPLVSSGAVCVIYKVLKTL